MKTILNIVFLGLMAFVAKEGFAGQLPGAKITKFHIELMHSVTTNRHWAIPEGEKKQGEVNAFFELRNKPEWLYSRSFVESFYTNSQFRYVSLTQEFGVEPGNKGIELFFHHQSEHALDFATEMDYPNSNGVGIRFKFVE